MSANYAIYTSPSHQPIPDHLPTLIITPHGKPHQILYTYLHTNYNQENYLLTPSDQGDLCVAKLFPPSKLPRSNPAQSGSSSGHGHKPDRHAIKCEASRNLKWTIRNEGIQHPVFKLTLPNPDNPQVEQPLFQVSKPNPNCPWWSLFYFTYAGHLIPPKRIEFGKIVKTPAPDGRRGSGETKITVTGKTEEEKAVWKTLGEGNEDMVEWILVCAALNVLDDEISKAAEAAGVKMGARPSAPRPSAGPHPTAAANRVLHPTGQNSPRGPAAAPIRPAIYHHPTSRAPADAAGPPRAARPPAERSAPNTPAHGQPRPPQFHASPSHRPQGGHRVPPPGGSPAGGPHRPGARQMSLPTSRSSSEANMFDDSGLAYARPSGAAEGHHDGARPPRNAPAPTSLRAMAGSGSIPVRPPQHHYVGPSAHQAPGNVSDARGASGRGVAPTAGYPAHVSSRAQQVIR